jgi:hypothetical protein
MNVQSSSKASQKENTRAWAEHEQQLLLFFFFFLKKQVSGFFLGRKKEKKYVLFLAAKLDLLTHL